MPEKTKKSKRDSQIVVRINSKQRDDFVAMCDELDTSASREIRRFIKEFLQNNSKNHDGS